MLSSIFDVMKQEEHAKPGEADNKSGYTPAQPFVRH